LLQILTLFNAFWFKATIAIVFLLFYKNDNLVEQVNFATFNESIVL